jgi:adenylate cyclase
VGPAGRARAAYPSLALAAALATAGSAVDAVGEAASLARLAADLRVDASARMLLNFRGPEFTFPKVKFVNILESINRVDAGEAPLYPPETFRDKIVLVGIHAEGYEDAHPTPLSERFPGVELHATALDNLLRARCAVRARAGSSRSRPAPPCSRRRPMFAFPASLARSSRCSCCSRRPRRSRCGSGRRSSRCRWPRPLVAGGAAASGAFLYRLVVEGKQKRELQRAFRSYLAPRCCARCCAIRPRCAWAARCAR